MERACQINDELAKLKLAQSTLNNGGIVRIYSSLRSSAGCVDLDVTSINEKINACITDNISSLEHEIETL